MNEKEKKTYEFLLKNIEESKGGNLLFAIARLEDFVKVIDLRIKAEKGKGAWC